MDAGVNDKTLDNGALSVMPSKEEKDGLTSAVTVKSSSNDVNNLEGGKAL